LNFSLLISLARSLLESSRHNYFAFIPEGLHLDRRFTANNPG
jgi:hypothetical protein